MLEVNSLVLILLVVLIVLIFVFIALLSFFGLKYLKTSQSSLSKAVQSPADIKIKRASPNADLLKALRAKQVESDLFCHDHSDRVSVGVCAISGEHYCEECLTKQEDVRLAKKYADIYLDNDWEEVLMLANSGISSENIDRIVELKHKLWANESVPMIVQGHYKINVEKDDIESYTVVIARKEDQVIVKSKLEFIQ